MKKLIIICILALCLSNAEAAPNLNKRGRKAKHSQRLQMYEHSGDRRSNWLIVYCHQWEAPKQPIWYPAYKRLKKIKVLKNISL